MKILYITPNFTNFPFDIDGMMKALAKYSEVVFYGPNFDLFDQLKFSTDIVEVIDHIYGGMALDVILMWDPQGSGWVGQFSNMDKVDCLKVIWSVDTHNDAVPRTLEYIRRAGINLLLISYDAKLKSEGGRIMQSWGLPIEFYPVSVNPEKFKPLNLQKKYDISLIGNMSSSYYPLRNMFHSILNKESGLRYHHPELTRYWGEDYIRHINESRICLTCSSSYKYPLGKYFEFMSCQALMMADTPMSAEELHFIPGYNFVEVNGEDLVSKVRYYLDHEGEANKIAENAREMILKYHTHDIRAKEIVGILSRYVEAIGKNII